MPKSRSNQNTAKNPGNVYHGYRGQLLNPQSTSSQRANALQHISQLEKGVHSTQGQSHSNSQALVQSQRSSPYGSAYAAHRTLPPSTVNQSTTSTAPQPSYANSQAVQRQPVQWANTQQTTQVDNFRVTHPALKQPVNVERTKTTTVTEEWRVW
ncbi:hypothetical protein JCM6882_003100 [Rhodosporidiobolus microsporus]